MVRILNFNVFTPQIIAFLCVIDHAKHLRYQTHEMPSANAMANLTNNILIANHENINAVQSANMPSAVLNCLILWLTVCRKFGVSAVNSCKIIKEQNLRRNKQNFISFQRVKFVRTEWKLKCQNAVTINFSR